MHNNPPVCCLQKSFEFKFSKWKPDFWKGLSTTYFHFHTLIHPYLHISIPIHSYMHIFIFLFTYTHTSYFHSHSHSPHILSYLCYSIPIHICSHVHLFIIHSYLYHSQSLFSVNQYIIRFNYSGACPNLIPGKPSSSSTESPVGWILIGMLVIFT